jgi:hypothetical protein
LNSTDTDGYVTVRHKGLIYQGYLKGFSSGGEDRELLLTAASRRSKVNGGEVDGQGECRPSLKQQCPPWDWASEAPNFTPMALRRYPAK